jgi:C4-dicarboxylate-specific signal transduction histidine kinase
VHRLILKLGAVPKPKLWGAGLLAVFLFGCLDYITGPDIGFSVFYLLPISAIAWTIGRTAGIVMAAAGAALWLSAELIWKPEYVLSPFPYWNALIRFSLFGIVVLLLTQLKRTNEHLEQMVTERTASLEKEIEEREQTQAKLIESERKSATGEMGLALAHHINNPLAVLMLAVQLKLKEDLPDDLRQEYLKWQTQLERIRDVVMQLTHLKETRSVEIGGGFRMIDIEGKRPSSEQGTGSQ